MKEWMEIGIHKVNAILAQDEDYHNLILQLESAFADYEKAMEPLSEQQREQIENYIALCEEVEYQKTLMAYYCGK